MTMSKYFLAAFLCAAMLCAQEPPQGLSSKVTQVAGPPGMPGHKLTLTATRESLALTDLKTGAVLTIPMSQISEVRYSTSDFDRSQQVVGNKYGKNGFVEPSHDDDCLAGDHGCHAASLIVGLLFGLATSGTGTSYFITVTWKDRGVEQQTRLDVPKKDEFKVTTELEKLVGDRWTGVDDDAEGLGDGRMLNPGKPVNVDIARDSWCGDFALRPGSYRVYARERGSAILVYFFAERDPVVHPTAIVRAQKEPVTPGPTIEYAGGSGRIVSLGMPDIRLICQ